MKYDRTNAARAFKRALKIITEDGVHGGYDPSHHGELIDWIKDVVMPSYVESASIDETIEFSDIADQMIAVGLLFHELNPKAEDGER